MARTQESPVNDRSPGDRPPASGSPEPEAKSAPGHGLDISDAGDEVAPAIDTVRRGVAHVLQAVTESVQETIGRRDAMTADTRRAEERLAALEANRSILRELGATRAQVEELTHDLETLRAERVDLLRSTEQSLRSAIELRESLIAEIAELQSKRDRLAMDVERAGPAATQAPTRKPVPSREQPPVEEGGTATESPSGAPAAIEMLPAETGGRRRGSRFAILRYGIMALFTLLILALAVLLTPLPKYAGWQVLTVQSGSMEPTIPVGAVVFEPVQQISVDAVQPGDIITFATEATGPDTPVTHRVVRIETVDGQRKLVTKGDANNTEDSWTVPASQTVTRVVAWAPYLGYARVWLSTTLARSVIIGIAFLGLVLPALWPRGREDAATSTRTESFDDLSRDIDALLGPDGAASSPGRGARR